MQSVIFMANGVEECEALLVVDLLRRAGLSIDMVSVHKTKQIESAHNVKIECDKTLDQVDGSAVDLYVVPGGLKGVDNLMANEKVSQLLLDQHNKKKLLAAICAGPTVLSALGILDDKNATVYPGMEEDLGSKVHFKDKDVIQDGHVISSHGLGAAIPFALHLISVLKDQETADKVAKAIVYK